MVDDYFDNEALGDSKEEDESSEADRFLLGTTDWSIVKAARDLLWKMARAPFVRPRELLSIAKVLHTLERLPRVARTGDVSISLCGPRKWFGDHEIWHWWAVAAAGDSLSISSGGHFYRDSSGGDSFTCMTWSATPGFEPEFHDFLNSLQIVDDAEQFDIEVDGLDLRQPGYRIELHDEGNELEEDSEDDVEDAQDAGI